MYQYDSSAELSGRKQASHATTAVACDVRRGSAFATVLEERIQSHLIEAGRLSGAMLCGKVRTGDKNGGLWIGRLLHGRNVQAQKAKDGNLLVHIVDGKEGK
jgi:hypothetical protein